MTTLVAGPSIFFQIMNTIKKDLVAAFQADGSSFGRTVIMPAAIAWDECDSDQCGLLAIAQTRIFLSDDVPNEAVLANIDNASLLLGDFVVQAIRCAPMPDEKGNPPGVDALERSAAQISTDQTLVFCTVTDTLQRLSSDMTGYVIDYVIKASMMAGPEGGCVGSELGFTVGVPR